MKLIKLFSIVSSIGCLLFATKTDAQEINDPLDIQLKCEVQQNGGTTNLEISTQALLELVAADQGFALPVHARLWLSGSSFVVLRQDSTVLTAIDTNILNVTYTTMIVNSKSTQTSKSYLSTVDAKPVAILNYNGTSLSFSFNFIGGYHISNSVSPLKANNNAAYSTSFSGSGFGSGICGSQNMVITGTITGNNSYRYSTGGSGLGAFPTGASSP
jgi:hypothetical protein